MKISWLSPGEKKILYVVSFFLLLGIVAKWLPKWQIETPALNSPTQIAGGAELKEKPTESFNPISVPQQVSDSVMDSPPRRKVSTTKADKSYIEAKNTNNSNSSKNKSKKIDLNKADKTQLEQIKGIGPVTAAAILKYREENGPFQKGKDLQKVKGIGPKKLKKILEQVILSREGP